MEDIRRVNKDILDTLDALFPAAELSVGRGLTEGVNFRFVLSPRRTHMLVPAESATAAMHAIERRTAKDTLAQVSRRRAVATVLRVPVLSSLFMPDVLQIRSSSDSLLTHLSEVVGEDVRFSIAIGSRRANRKPVLSVFTVTDREVGFAKVGLTPLANALIDHEATVLRSLEETLPVTFRAPRLIYHGGWNRSRILLMESLRPSRRRPRMRAPLDAMAEIASRTPLSWDKTATSEWMGVLGHENSLLEGGAHPRLTAAIENFKATFGDVSIPMGYWHGDLGPWNMAWHESTPLIWDWERATAPVPVGLDSMHFACHTSLRDVGNLVRARQALAGQGAQTLQSVVGRLGVGPLNTHQTRTIVAAYLLTVATRFAVDARRPDGEDVQTLADWYSTVLEDQLKQGVS